MWDTIHFDFIYKCLNKGLDFAHARVVREQWDKIHVDKEKYEHKQWLNRKRRLQSKNWFCTKLF